MCLLPADVMHCLLKLLTGTSSVVLGVKASFPHPPHSFGGSGTCASWRWPCTRCSRSACPASPSAGWRLWRTAPSCRACCSRHRCVLRSGLLVLKGKHVLAWCRNALAGVGNGYAQVKSYPLQNPLAPLTLLPSFAHPPLLPHCAGWRLGAGGEPAGGPAQVHGALPAQRRPVGRCEGALQGHAAPAAGGCS